MVNEKELLSHFFRTQNDKFQKCLDPTLKCEGKPINAHSIQNARGHAFYEYGEPMLDDPKYAEIVPLATLTEKQRIEFEDIPNDNRWPEVGSRMLTRMVTGKDLDGLWVVVQKGVYR